MLELIFLIVRGIAVACRGHYDLVLENIALRQQVIVLNETHLRRLLRAYLAYYHRSRTHLSLKKDAPDGRPPCAGSGRLVVTPEVGGLHHRYDRQVA